MIAYRAAFFCGLFPSEYYEGEFALSKLWSMDLFYISLAIALVAIALYVLAFFLSNKNRVGWLIFALVFFSLDTVMLINSFGIYLDMILDYAFHAWIIVILSIGIRAHFALKQLPEDDDSTRDAPLDGETVERVDLEELSCNADDSVALRTADMGVKSRIFLQAQSNGKTIVYRRVQRTNELVIDGLVYDEYEALVEQAHVLCATIDGHAYEVGINAAGIMFIMVDGQKIAKKMRII